jgi:hypothetical protein
VLVICNRSTVEGRCRAFEAAVELEVYQDLRVAVLVPSRSPTAPPAPVRPAAGRPAFRSHSTCMYSYGFVSLCL